MDEAVEFVFDLCGCFVKSQSGESLSGAEDDGNEDNSVVSGDHRSVHLNVRTSGKEQVQTVPYIVFNSGQRVKF